MKNKFKILTYILYEKAETFTDKTVKFSLYICHSFQCSMIGLLFTKVPLPIMTYNFHKDGIVKIKFKWIKTVHTYGEHKPINDLYLTPKGILIIPTLCFREDNIAPLKMP